MNLDWRSGNLFEEVSLKLRSEGWVKLSLRNQVGVEEFLEEEFSYKKAQRHKKNFVGSKKLKATVAGV